MCSRRSGARERFDLRGRWCRTGVPSRGAWTVRVSGRIEDRTADPDAWCRDRTNAATARRTGWPANWLAHPRAFDALACQARLDLEVFAEWPTAAVPDP